MIDDATLIARVISCNDHYAYTQLVNKYQSGIRHFLRRLTVGEHALADDIAQETFITLYKKLSTFRGDSSLNTWLHKIAYHHFLKVGQKKYRQLEESSEKLSEEFSNELSDKFTISAFQSDKSEQHNQVEQDILIEQLMAKLTIEQRTCLTLSISAGMSHSEIAEVTQFPLGTIKSHINRAQQKLMDLFNPLAIGELKDEK